VISLLSLLFLILPGTVLSYKSISDETLQSLPRPNDDFNIQTGALLAPILRTRVPGTEGSRAVLNHFVDFFRNVLPDWNIEFQNSTSRTPVHGNEEVPFVNLIASRDPPWAEKGDVGRLTLVAHYDSKITPEGFIGAIDSAAPCAMIMHVVRSIDAALTRKWEVMTASGESLDDSLEGYTGIQVIFLDGEEAFKYWTATDSLYGARSLAEEWDNTAHAAMSNFKTPLSSITLFVLLDLLGSANPAIRSYFPTTHWAYQSLAKLEHRLRDLQEFKSSPNHPSKRIIQIRDDDGHQYDHNNQNNGVDSMIKAQPQKRVEEPTWFIDGSNTDMHISRSGTIQDDHIPFLQRGVETLHIIDTPRFTGFPSVWHTLDDDGEHLDLDTVEDWSMLMTAFVAEWMELEGFVGILDGSGSAPVQKRAIETNMGSGSLVGTAVQSKESTSGGTAQIHPPGWKRSVGKTEL
jgi:glutaminyl-peptide cyclotransferase